MCRSKGCRFELSCVNGLNMAFYIGQHFGGRFFVLSVCPVDMELA
jgi:hypothetical protein